MNLNYNTKNYNELKLQKLQYTIKKLLFLMLFNVIYLENSRVKTNHTAINKLVTKMFLDSWLIKNLRPFSYISQDMSPNF